MNKPLITALVIALLAGLVIATLWQSDYGYVLISNGQWTSDRSLAQFAVLMLIAFSLFYIFIRLLIRLLFLPSAVIRYQQRKQQERARQNIIHGLINIIEGRPKKAERILLKNIEHSDTKLINYLLAARAAQLEDADDRRDEYLKLAHNETPRADMAIGLTQAELQLAHNQTEQALATLSRLRELDPKHIYVLKLLVRLYLQLNEWGKLVKLLPDIRKHSIIPDDKLIDIERSAYSAYLQDASRQQNTPVLKERWKEIPKAYQGDEKIIQVYTECLLKANENDLSETLLRRKLNNSWSESLVILYGLIKSSNLNKQLEYAENWKRGHDRSAGLMLTLARLCHRLRLWGKSRVYFETSISIKPTVEAYKELGDLLTSLGETENAYHCWHEGITLAAKNHSRRSASEGHNTPSPLADTSLSQGPTNGMKY